LPGLLCDARIRAPGLRYPAIRTRAGERNGRRATPKSLGPRKRKRPAKAGQLGHERVGRDEREPIAVALEPEATIAGDLIADAGEDVLGEVVLRVLGEGALHLVGGDARGRGVPERERRDSVRVDVLGRLLELGEARQALARDRVRRRHGLGEDGPVRLDDERGFRVVGRQAAEG
jgi:hypothetical protein